MVIKKHFPEEQIWWLIPEKTIIKLFNHHPEVKQNFDVQFKTLREFFVDKINFISDTKKYILNQINKKYPELKSYNDIILDNIEIKEVKKENVEKNIINNINNHIWINHYLNNAENKLATIVWKIRFKSSLYLNIKKELDFTIYVNQSNFDILTDWKINYSFDIYYWLESEYDPSSPEIDIYFTENEKLWKRSKQKMFKQLDHKIKDFINNLNLSELLEDDFRNTIANFDNLPSYQKFKDNKKELIEQLNSWNIDSKYLYDWNGSRKFIWVIDSPNYYLKEHERLLLEKYKKDLNKNIIDLWSWNWEKALNFLENTETNYFWIDSSISMLLELAKKTNHFQKKWIKRKNINIDFSQLHKLKNIDNKTLLFLGSTLWNFLKTEQVEILSLLEKTLSKNDNIIIGLDLENSDIKKIIKAYSSDQSKEFIFSLFKELWFNEDDLELKVQYHPLIQTVETWVIIKRDINIHTEYWIINKKKWDYIKCISSEKFTENKIEKILKQSWLEIKSKNIQNNYWVFILKKIKDKIREVA